MKCRILKSNGCSWVMINAVCPNLRKLALRKFKRVIIRKFTWNNTPLKMFIEITSFLLILMLLLELWSAIHQLVSTYQAINLKKP